MAGARGGQGEGHLQAELGVSVALEALGFPLIIICRWLGAQGKSFHLTGEAYLLKLRIDSVIDQDVLSLMVSPDSLNPGMGAGGHCQSQPSPWFFQLWTHMEIQTQTTRLALPGGSGV